MLKKGLLLMLACAIAAVTPLSAKDEAPQKAADDAKKGDAAAAGADRAHQDQAYLREVYRAEGKLGSRYDSNVTSYDPFPFAPNQRYNDPILDSIIAPTWQSIPRCTC